MEFAKLKYFVCVASSETMQQAAEVLNVSQSTLSMAFTDWRKSGVQLFQKVGRKLQLTEAGAACRLRLPIFSCSWKICGTGSVCIGRI